MDIIKLSENDVISFEDFKPLGLAKTNKVSECQKKLGESLNNYGRDNDALLNPGIKCEILQLGSQEWKKGKIRVQFEFIPEEITESSVLDEFRAE
jgi:hypothetical protein